MDFVSALSLTLFLDLNRLGLSKSQNKSLFFFLQTNEWQKNTSCRPRRPTLTGVLMSAPPQVWHWAKSPSCKRFASSGESAQIIWLKCSLRWINYDKVQNDWKKNSSSQRIHFMFGVIPSVSYRHSDHFKHKFFWVFKPICSFFFKLCTVRNKSWNVLANKNGLQSL